MSYCILLRSESWGHGKTVAGLKYYRPGTDTKRLVIDKEVRSEQYLSSDGQDHPDALKWNFDLYRNEYGDSGESLVKLLSDIKSGDFKYNVVFFDNIAMFQYDLFGWLQDKAIANSVAKQAGNAANICSQFLAYKWKPYGTEYYHLLKTIIREMLVMLRKANIDVVGSTETRNVWHNYGKSGQKIVAKTAKVWDPWLQMSDVILVLNRVVGNRDLGNAKMRSHPTATMDTYNPKCSIPGVKPQFELKDWDTFWEMIATAQPATDSELSSVSIEQSENVEYVPETLEEAKASILSMARERGFTTKKLLEIGSEYTPPLSNEDALSRYTDWVMAICQREKK